MDFDAHLAALRREGDLLAAAVEQAGPAADVPTCPGWHIRDLVRHVSGVHRWATAHVTECRLDPYPADEEAAFFDEPASDLVAHFQAGHEALLGALAAAPPDLRALAFLPAPSPREFWARRQAHETAIHRADAEVAAGVVTTYPADFAVDGIDELLGGFLARPGGGFVADPPVSLAVRPQDADRSWTFHIGPSGRRVEAGAGPADLTVTGLASDLYLFLWNRLSPDRVALAGDASIVDLWRSRARILW
jgi:uncharacterized protein (TIGR03083 family)